MKILLANKFYYPRGGDCICTIDLKNLLELNGHDVAIFAMQHPNNLANEYSKYWPSEVSLGEKDIANISKALTRPFGTKEVNKKWKQLIDTFQPDIIHLHNIHTQLSPSLAKIAKERHIPVVWTLHDYKLICPAYTFQDNNGKICTDCITNSTSILKKKCIKGSLIGSILGLGEIQYWNKEKLQIYTNKFIAPSKFMKDMMTEGGFSTSKITQVYNFIDDTKLQDKIELNRTKKYIYVGRISAEKGIETLCKAFNEINGYTLEIYGDGPLKKVLTNKYSSSKIIFKGFQSWNKIKIGLKKSKALIVPSEWYENNPLTILESFAVGTPVIGSNIGGIPELIDENKNGFLFKPKDVDSLVSTINTVSSKANWNYLEIQQAATNKYQSKKYIKQILHIYKNTI